MEPHGLADAPLDAVAHHGLAERAWCCKPDSGPIGLGLADAKRREKRAGKAYTLVINSSEVFRSQHFRIRSTMAAGRNLGSVESDQLGTVGAQPARSVAIAPQCRR